MRSLTCLVMLAAFLCACTQQDKTGGNKIPEVQVAAADVPQGRDFAANDRTGGGGPLCLPWSIAFEPDHPASTDVVRAKIKATGVLPSNISYTYTWEVNRHVIDNVIGDSLPNEYFKKKDIVRLTVKISAGEMGTYYISRALVVADRRPSLEIKVLETNFKDEIKMQLLSGDTDSGTLIYSLEPPVPEGMTLNADDGIIRWNMPPGYRGTLKFLASVQDAEGAKITRPFEITVSEKSVHQESTN